VERTRPEKSLGTPSCSVYHSTIYLFNRCSHLDRLRWYCHSPAHDKPTIIYEESFHVTDLGSQLKPVIERWQTTEELRKCKDCGTIANMKWYEKKKSINPTKDSGTGMDKMKIPESRVGFLPHCDKWHTISFFFVLLISSCQEWLISNTKKGWPYFPASLKVSKLFHKAEKKAFTCKYLIHSL